MIRFGPSGNSARYYSEGNKSTLDAMKWVSEQGLNAYEYSFGRGINISDATANAIGEEANKYNIEFSVHAPYYINFANPSDDMAEKSFNYVLNSAKKVKEFGGQRVVFHPASVGKASRQDAVSLTTVRLHKLVEKIYDNNLSDCIFCPETMGKINQIGDFYEVIEFCKIDDCFTPTIDFGHLNARTFGALKTENDYEKLILHMIDQLGQEKASKMHIHFSKIEFSQGGEVRHLTFEDKIYGPEFYPLACVLVKHNLEPVIICESDGTQADDAISMKNIYNSVMEGK